jgi:hypothetical protein
VRPRHAALPAIFFCAWPSLAAAQTDRIFLDGFQWTPSTCYEAAARRTSVGCEFWAADLDNAVEVVDVQGSLLCQFTPGVINVSLRVCANASSTAVAGLCDPPADACPTPYTCRTANVCILNAQNSPFAIQVTNPQPGPVTVTVRSGGGTTFMQGVPAGQSATLMPQANGIPDQSLDGTGIAARAYQVTADVPIAAYQVNATDFSTGSSLLLPRATYDAEYRVLTWPTFNRRTPPPGTHDLHGYVAIVAPQDGTVVEVTPSAVVRASASQPSIPAGSPSLFTLDAHDVLTLQAVPDGDLSGTLVRCPSGECGVFAGHEAAAFGETTPPDGTHLLGPCCADHFEEMVFPTSSWGKTFAVARSAPRGTNERDVLRILAQKPGTLVTIQPSADVPCPMLGTSQSCEVKIMADTVVSASEPILVGHYLQSAIWTDPFLGGSVGDGDPALALAAPTEQYRREHSFAVPPGYTQSFLAISSPASGIVTVDGLPVSLTPFAGGVYQAGRVPVAAGPHRVSCPAGCGVLVHGYSDAAAYMFAAGLDLVPLVSP